ncbi:MAG: hypothetical protein WDO18_05085 [Acidobacteriota bacterium]
MKIAHWGTLALAAFLGTVACSSVNIDNKDAVRSAMIEYLEKNKASTGIDPNAMDVKVDVVVFERDTANATVAFTVKGSDQGMHGNYTLTREGNKWGNVKRQNLTAAPHDIEGGTPAGPIDQTKEPLLPVMPGGAPGAQGLPAGHPPVPTGAK